VRLRFAIHKHDRDEGEVEDIVRFAFAPLARALEGITVAVKIQEPNGHQIPTGWATSGGRRWAGRVKHCVITGLPDEAEAKYRVPRVCYHAFDYDRDGSPSAFDAEVAKVWESGGVKWKRWPIYVVTDWREALVHIAAHEGRHIAQYVNHRSRSEVDCEEYALARLVAWKEQEARPRWLETPGGVAADLNRYDRGQW
jgi:hypothetical protein